MGETILTHAFGRGSSGESGMYTYDDELITENMIWVVP